MKLTYAENYYGCVAIVLPAQQTPTTNAMYPHAMAPFQQQHRVVFLGRRQRRPIAIPQS